jgi:hypothetical protein
VEKDFVAGPFDTPPLKNFRVNRLLAIEQPSKIRPVLNLSAPVGASFNDNINENLLEKVEMATEKQFGYLLKECGAGARFSKFDTKDAYKCIPAPVWELRLQGFSWLNKYFFEKKQVFCSKAAVPNYDRFGNTLKTLAVANAGIQNRFVLRCLDDVPVVGPKGSNICDRFSVEYMSLCENCNVGLAEPCKNNEKTFINQSCGKVLGIWFNSDSLTWKYPEEKSSKTLSEIKKFLSSGSINLKEMESLMGRLNDFLQMCPFMKDFKFNLNNCLSKCIQNGFASLTKNVEFELNVWANCISENADWFPIPPPPPRPSAPTIRHKLFVSDEAGVLDINNFKRNVGVGGVAFDEEGCFINAYQFFWETDFISWQDEKGSTMGSKTTTLEMIGILIHILLVPSLLIKQNVVFVTDNLACVYGWENKCVKHDVCASIIVRAIHLISALLECNVFICHKKRCSDWV